MTNADKIRQMTDDEELLTAIGLCCDRCEYSSGECDTGCAGGCAEGNLAWLKHECGEQHDRGCAEGNLAWLKHECGERHDK